MLEVNGLKTEIRRLKEVISEAKTKEKAAQDECKRLEKEIKDFKNNKDSKLKEIKVSGWLIGGSAFPIANPLLHRPTSRIERKRLTKTPLR